MIKHTTYLLAILLSLAPWSQTLASEEDHEREVSMHTLAAVNRFKLPEIYEADYANEEECFEIIYSFSDPKDTDLQAMLDKFKQIHHTEPEFKKNLCAAVLTEGPLKAHEMIMEFSYVLSAHAMLQYWQSDSGPLFDYYHELASTMGKRFKNYEVYEDERVNDDSDVLEEVSRTVLKREFRQVLTSVECLFPPCYYDMLYNQVYPGTGMNASDRSVRIRLPQENKAKIYTKGSNLIINTAEIEAVLKQFPTEFDKVESLHELTKENFQFLLSKLQTCKNLKKLHLRLDNPSKDTLLELLAFIDARREIRDLRVECATCCRINPDLYDQFRALDKLIYDRNWRA